MANEFDKFVIVAESKITGSIPPKDLNLISYLTGDYMASFFFRHVTLEVVKKLQSRQIIFWAKSLSFQFVHKNRFMKLSHLLFQL